MFFLFTRNVDKFFSTLSHDKNRRAQLFIANYKKVNISGKLQYQWEASTLINSQKSMAENVVAFVDIKKIGEDWEGETEAYSIT